MCFFVRVRERLVNIEDPLFGLNPLSHQTFNRFRADLKADDLKSTCRSREGVESASAITGVVRAATHRAVLRSPAATEHTHRARRATTINNPSESTPPQDVAPDLVERPVADALSVVLGDVDEVQDGGLEGADADDKWFYLELAETGTRVGKLLEEPLRRATGSDLHLCPRPAR